MSLEVNLYFKKSLDLELLQKGLTVHLVRLMAAVQFKAKGGDWSREYEAIIDTGAPVSVLPNYIWHQSEVQLLADYRISGIVPKKECSLPVKVGKTFLRLIDRNSATKQIEMLAYLVPTDKVPIILGFRDLLAEGKVNFCYQKEEASIILL